MSRLSLGPLLRLRSDDQLVAAFRSGSEDAFATLHARYQPRLYAYARQMLGGSNQDAEDVLQDVFVRAYGALRADDRDVNVRAWLYRVAHNRCIDHLRRPNPPASEIFEMSRKPAHDPFELAQRREDLRRLVKDVGRLPDQQRSALLMREIDGLTYAELALALDTSVPAVKSLLVRARVGLVEAVEARDMDCSVIRGDLLGAYDRGVKASGRARRHMRECEGCREYRAALRQVQRSFASLSPLGAGPLALAAKVLGLGGAGGGAAASAGAGSGGVVMSTGIGAASACKVAAVVCTAAIATGGAVEVKRTVKPESASAATAPRAVGPAAASRALAAPSATVSAALLPRHPAAPAAAGSAPTRDARRAKRIRAGAPLAARTTTAPSAPAAGLPAQEREPAADVETGAHVDVPEENPTGGAAGPEEADTPSPSTTTTAEPTQSVTGADSEVPGTTPSPAPAGDPATTGGVDAPAATPARSVTAPPSP